MINKYKQKNRSKKTVGYLKERSVLADIKNTVDNSIKDMEKIEECKIFIRNHYQIK